MKYLLLIFMLIGYLGFVFEPFKKYYANIRYIFILILIVAGITAFVLKI